MLHPEIRSGDPGMKAKRLASSLNFLQAFIFLAGGGIRI
jgi:hypothetical protein